MIEYNLLIVLIGTIMIGMVSGVVGSFAVLRKQSLLGDAISHAALPGVGLAFMLTLSKNPFVLLLGAMAAGWLGTMLIMLITSRTKIKEDSALGIVLASFFGLGLFLLTIIQKLPSSNKAGLDTYLFGNASTLLRSDIYAILIFGIITLILVMIYWKEIKLFVFDKSFCETLGFRTINIDIFITSLIVVAIVIGLQAVGVVLMSALIIAPGASARQWTDSLSRMVIISSLIGALSSALGSYISSLTGNVPTGPMIVVVLSIFVFISIMFSPHRGLVQDWIRHITNKGRVLENGLLMDFFYLSKNHKDPYHPHPVGSIKGMGHEVNMKIITKLIKKGLMQQKRQGYSLTGKGIEKARLMAGGNADVA